MGRDVLNIPGGSFKKIFVFGGTPPTLCQKILNFLKMPVDMFSAPKVI